MKGPFSKSPRYGLIVDQDKEERSPVEADEPGQKTTAIEKSARPWMLWVLLLLMVTAVLTATLFVRYTRESTYRSSSSCAKSALRREWRSLKLAEKQEYIKAVNCLRDQPSRLGLDQSLYDDFSYTHARSGVSAHYSAAFIPWHRYFIHTYEEALRLQCSYSGHLTYWDWTLDWEDFSTSPVWSIETGFGGSGDPEVGEDILGGHCVTTGPFANLHVTYLEQVYKPHCLSRGFIHNTTELAVHNALYSPMRVHQILRSKTYEEFNFELEDGPHNGVPRSIRGDFNNLTAPADPVFFLHHTQLDRLWWTWQVTHPQQANDYQGAAAHESKEKASLLDRIIMGGLAEDIRVAEVIDTQSGILCYQY